MRVLGIDPGTAIVGFSVLEKKDNNINPLSYGQIVTHKNKSGEERLLEIYDNISEVISRYSPEELAIEKLYFNKNITTAMAVSEARGVLLLAGVLNRLRVSEYTPLQIKQAVTGHGRAPKRDVQQMVKKILNLSEVPKPDDVADAIAVGICHLNFFNEADYV
ncbi:MAG: crossover junction endodeoxyribonuclease RuvC [Candidatus Muiribacteriota bacterium]